MTQNEPALLDVAVHEAGHAVMAHALGVRVIKATIGGADGAWTWHRKIFRHGQRPEHDKSHANRLRAERYALIALGGDIAERRFNPGRQRADKQDQRQVRILLGLFARSPAHHAKWLAALEQEAEEIIGQSWLAVEAVAAALARRGAMNGRQITDCIKSVRPLG